MKPNELAQIIGGSLLVGASVLSGNPTVMAVAGGVGVNLVSDVLPTFWQGLRAPEAGSALARAHANALRRAVQELETIYRRERDPRADGSAFALLAASADQLLHAEIVLPAPTLGAVRQALHEALPAVLHGHDPREVEWLQTHLLPATARAFHRELERDADARQAFSLQLIGLIAQRLELLGESASRLPALLDALSTASAQLDALQRGQSMLDAALEALLASGHATDSEQFWYSAYARGDQSEATTYNEGTLPSPPPQGAPNERTVVGSAWAEEGGRATVTNRNVSDSPASHTPREQGAG